MNKINPMTYSEQLAGPVAVPASSLTCMSESTPQQGQHRI